VAGLGNNSKGNVYYTFKELGVVAKLFPFQFTGFLVLIPPREVISWRLANTFLRANLFPWVTQINWLTEYLIVFLMHFWHKTR
jgi:hypothetical protein